MLVEIKIQKSSRDEWTTHHQSEHTQSQISLRRNPVLQQTHLLELKSSESYGSEYGGSSNCCRRMIMKMPFIKFHYFSPII